MSILKHRNGRAKPDDLESGPSTPTSPNFQDKDTAPNYDGEEYDVLLRFSKDQAALENKQSDEDDDEADRPRKRLWYAPWKTVAVQSDKEKKVRVHLPLLKFEAQPWSDT